jgi:hypothetical protein
MLFVPMPIYWLASSSPDLSSTVLQLTAFYYFIKLLREKSCSEKRETYIAFIAVIAAVSTVIKLSNAAFSIGLGLTSYLLVKRSDSKVFFGGRLIKAFTFITILLVIWFCRGYMEPATNLPRPRIGSRKSRLALPESLPKLLKKEFIVFTARSYNLTLTCLKIYWIRPWLET